MRDISLTGQRALRAGCCLLAFGLGLAGSSSAGVPGAEERLVLEPYPASPTWKEVTHKSAGAKFLIEQIPADQDVEDYRDILIAQSYPEIRAQDPSVFLRGIFTRTVTACNNVRVNGPKAQTEAGFAVAYGQIYCGRQRDKPFGVHMFFKVIQGQDALYVIERESRVPASEVGGVMSFSKDQAAAAIAMLKSEADANHYLVESVYLCGGVSTGQRCAIPQAK